MICWNFERFLNLILTVNFDVKYIKSYTIR